MGLHKKHDSLTGKLLFASPSLSGSCFQQAVVMMCSHSDEGAMGIIINRPLPEVNGQSLLKRFGISEDDKNTLNFPIRFGGPVEMNRGFILHSGEYSLQETLTVEGDFGLTCNTQILRDIAGGSGPEHSLFTIGYSGWSAEQLEEEIAEGCWLVADADASLVFNEKSDEQCWFNVAETIGIKDASFLSSEVGHA